MPPEPLGRRQRIVLGLLLAAGLGVGPAAGEPVRPAPPRLFEGFSFTSRKEPIEVTSNRLEFDYKQRRTWFRGDVLVKQGDIVLRSDTLTVTYAGEGDQQKLEEVLAEGHVTITQGARRATGDRAVFDDRTRTLVLTGRAVLQEGPNQLNGDTIIVYPDESRMEVKGENSRVKLVIFPREEPTPAPPSAPASPPTPNAANATPPSS